MFIILLFISYRKQPVESSPLIADARERIKMNRLSASSRLGYHAAGNESSSGDSDSGGCVSGTIPNLKIMVANDQDSWDDDEEDEPEEVEQRGVQDLRSRLESRRTNDKFLTSLPSLSIHVDREDFSY